jgi:hypothetical protein
VAAALFLVAATLYLAGLGWTFKQQMEEELPARIPGSSALEAAPQEEETVVTVTHPVKALDLKQAITTLIDWGFGSHHFSLLH